MHAKDYSDAYEFDTPDNSIDMSSLSDTNPSHKWSHVFGELIMDRLRDEASSSAKPDMDSLATRYVYWVQRARKSRIKNTPAAANFHTLNMAMAPIWAHVYSGAREIPVQDIETVQTLLACSSIDNLIARESLYKSRKLFGQVDISSQNYPRNRSLNPYLTEEAITEFGATNEFDTAITLLDISKENPEIAIIPAPQKFESGRNSMLNSDFIVLDMKNHQARGVQAKASVSSAIRANYDEKFVTLVDGNHDLGNVLSVAYDPDLPERKNIVSWPGLVSAHHLLNQERFAYSLPSGSKEHVRDAMMIQQSFKRSRWNALRLSQSTRSQNDEASGKVKERVLNDLYK